MGVHNALPCRPHFNMRLPLPSLLLVLPLLAMGDTESSSSEIASSRQSDGYGAPYAPPQQYQARPTYDSYSAPSYQAPTYQAPPPSYDSQPKHDYDYYKHEHHHYYHAGPPRVYKVPVPVTQKPHIVHVPQNVPVKFVGVNVPAPPPVQYVGQPVEITPQYGGVYHHSDSECYDYDLDCLANVARDFGLPVPRGGRSLVPGFGAFDDPYIKRKELIKSGLLLGAGVLKGALITTLINNANNNNGK